MLPANEPDACLELGFIEENGKALGAIWGNWCAQRRRQFDK
jgi:hypothetical protein